MASGNGLTPVRKIAVLRANSIGDFVFTLPALRALRETFTRAEIVLLGKPWHRTFAQGRGVAVDRVVAVPPIGGVTAPLRAGESEPERAEVEGFVSDLRAERFDLALQLHGGGRYSNPLVLELGARLTAGSKTADAAPLDRWIPYVYYHNEILRLLEVVALVGARTPHVAPQLNATERDIEEAQVLLAPLDLAPDDRLVVVHPGATDERRRWPGERFANVADRLADRGCKIAIVGDDSERELARAVVEEMKEDALDLAGQTTLGGLVGVLAHSSLALCNDSGPLHLALALDRAAVGIFWCGNVINGGGVTRAKFRPAISWRLTCPICGTHCTSDSCHHNVSFMGDVGEDEVLRYADDLLAQESISRIGQLSPLTSAGPSAAVRSLRRS